jgi:hypothetical protein
MSASESAGADIREKDTSGMTYKEGTWTRVGRTTDIFKGLPFRPTKSGERKLWRGLAKYGCCDECEQLTKGSLEGWAIWFTHPSPDETTVHMLCPHHAQIITRSQDGGTA